MGMETQSITSLVALELSAAFDTVNQENLLSTSTSDLDPSRLPSMVLAAKRGT